MQFQCSENIFNETSDARHSRLVLSLSARRRSSQLKHMQFFKDIKFCPTQVSNMQEVHHSRPVQCNGGRFYFKEKKWKIRVGTIT